MPNKPPSVSKMRGVDRLLTTTQPAPVTLLPLEQIQLRPQDTRPLNQTHVDSLAESITVFGLIQPIAVDSQGQLLAGGHRRAAIALLQEKKPSVFAKHFGAGVPVRTYDFDASQDEEMALAIEATENEKRRDYTAKEVRELADRLKAAGYHHTKGRTREGVKPLLPSLAVIVGKSERQIKRYLEGSVEILNGPHVPFSQRYLKKAILALQQYEKAEPSTPNEQKLHKEVAALIARLEEAITPET